MLKQDGHGNVWLVVQARTRVSMAAGTNLEIKRADYSTRTFSLVPTRLNRMVPVVLLTEEVRHTPAAFGQVYGPSEFVVIASMASGGQGSSSVVSGYGLRVLQQFQSRFATVPSVLAYAPGRIEVLGNHTDYNQGFVLSAAINLGTYFFASPRTDDVVTLHSLNMKVQRSLSSPCAST